MFLVNVPVCIVAFIAAAIYVPTSRDPDNRPLDPFGSLLSIVTLVGLLYTIIQAPESGWTATNVLIGFAVGSAFGGLFAAWELHTPGADARPPVLREPSGFSAASVTVTLVTFAVFGSTFLLTQYFQFVLGYSPLKSGLMAMPVAIGMMLAAPNAPRFVFRFGTEHVVVTGDLRDRHRHAPLRVEHRHVVVRRRRRGPAHPRLRRRASPRRPQPSRSWARCRSGRPGVGSAVNDLDVVRPAVRSASR